MRLQKLVAPVLVLATAVFGLAVATAAPASAADRQVTIHYHRADGNYSGWNLWMWVAGGTGDLGTDNPSEFNGEDDFGKKFTFNVSADGINKIGFIVRTNSWAKDPTDSPDRFIELPAEGTTDIWLMSGDLNVYKSNPIRTVTIHYNRPDAAYGDWNIWSWVAGDGTIPLGNPTEFNGDDSYGKKLTFQVTDPVTTKIGFIVRTNSWAKDPDGDRFINLNATGNTEVWLRSGDSTVYSYNPWRTVTIHYNRPDGEYAPWNMWTWVAAGECAGGPCDSGLSNPTEFNGDDAYGKSLTFTVKDPGIAKMGFIVRTNAWAKDPDGDRFLELPVKGNLEVWLKSGDSTIYTSDPRGRTLVIHYWRPAGDYGIWNLWFWSAGDGALDFINPEEFNGSDENGMTFTGVVTDAAVTRIGFIVRTNSWAKDAWWANGNGDRFINLTAATKQEVWLKQGVATVYYSNPWGDDPTVQSAAIKLSGLGAASSASLPAKTNRGSYIQWVSYTPNVCAIKGGHILHTYRPGACRIVGSAEATEIARAATFKRTVTIK